MTQVANTYAQALYSLAKDEDCCKVILDQLTVLQESFAAEPDFLRLLAAPNLSKEERCAIVDGSFRDKVHPYLLNFMKILTERAICAILPTAARHTGIATIRITVSWK